MYFVHPVSMVYPRVVCGRTGPTSLDSATRASPLKSCVSMFERPPLPPVCHGDRSTKGDSKGAWRDNVFIERLWKSVKYEEVYLTTYETVSQGRRVSQVLRVLQPLPATPKR
jgi:hypothetical protein